jgi:hypothetical protein
MTKAGVAALLSLLVQTGCMMHFSEVSTTLRVKDPKLAHVRRIDDSTAYAKANADACKMRREPDGALVETWKGNERYVVRADGVVLPNSDRVGDGLVPWGPDTHPPPWKDNTLAAPFCGCGRVCSPMLVITPEDNVKDLRQKSTPVYFGGAALVAGGLGLSAIGADFLLSAPSSAGSSHAHGTEFYAIDFPMFIVGAAMVAGGLSVLLSRPHEEILYQSPTQ